MVVILGCGNYYRGFLLGSRGWLPGTPSIEIHWPVESSTSGYIPSYTDTFAPSQDILDEFERSAYIPMFIL